MSESNPNDPSPEDVIDPTAEEGTARRRAFPSWNALAGAAKRVLRRRGGKHNDAPGPIRALSPEQEAKIAATRERHEREHLAAVEKARARRLELMGEHEDALHVRNLIRDGRPQRAYTWGTPSNETSKDNLNATVVVAARVESPGLTADLGALTRVAARTSDMVVLVAYPHRREGNQADGDNAAAPTFVCYRPSTGTLLFADGRNMPRANETATPEGTEKDRGLAHWGLLELGGAPPSSTMSRDGLYLGNHEIVRLWADTQADEIDVLRQVPPPDNAPIILGDETQQQVHGDEIFGGALASRGLYVDGIMLDKGTVAYAANRVAGPDGKGWEGQVGNYVDASKAPSPMLALSTLMQRVDSASSSVHG